VAALPPVSGVSSAAPGVPVAGGPAGDSGRIQPVRIRRTHNNIVVTAKRLGRTKLFFSINFFLSAQLYSAIRKIFSFVIDHRLRDGGRGAIVPGYYWLVDGAFRKASLPDLKKR
jgi:hypothetical protein